MKFLQKLAFAFAPKYNLVYTNELGHTKLYQFHGDVRKKEQFDNQKERRSEVGFRAYVVGKGYRSFRWDRVKSLARS
jgi:hypothetical protein